MSWLAGLGALSKGFVPGLETGMGLYDQYTDLQGQQIAGSIAPEFVQAQADQQRQLAAMMAMQQAPQPGAGAPRPPPVMPGAAPPPQAQPGAPQPVGGGLQTMGGGGPGPGQPIPAAMFSPQAAPGAVQGGAPSPAGPGMPPNIAPQMNQPNMRAAFQPPQPRQPPPQVDPEQHGTITPQAMRDIQMGRPGPLDMQQVMRRIDQQFPGASGIAKFKALKAATGLMTQAGQTQFNQMMQLANLQERQEARTQREADRKLQLALMAERMSPEHAAALQNARSSITVLTGVEKKYYDQYISTKTQSETLDKNMSQLIDYAKKVKITGNIKLDDWIRGAGAALGIPQPELAAYHDQVATVIMEAASIKNVRAGVITEGQRNEAMRALQPGAILPPKLFEELLKVWKVEAKNKMEASKRAYDEVRTQRENLAKGMPSEPATAPPATTGFTTAPSRKIDREKAKAAGYTDEEIDAYERGQ